MTEDRSLMIDQRRRDADHARAKKRMLTKSLTRHLEKQGAMPTDLGEILKTQWAAFFSRTEIKRELEAMTRAGRLRETGGKYVIGGGSIT